MTTYEVLEALMLMCFSGGWYFSVYKMLRVRSAAGKSLNFIIMVCTGYALGIASRVMDYHANGELNPVLWLYFWNLGVTLFDLSLVLHFSRRERRAALRAARLPVPDQADRSGGAAA